MRFIFTEEQNRFRQEVRDFLQAELKTGRDVDKSGGLAEASNYPFSKKMAERGWIGMTWPKKFGGQERTYVEKTILIEELFKAQAPVGYHFMFDRQIGPSIIHFGSDWQKEYFLPRFIRADPKVKFCLLFSEPNAGSDLSNVSTTAIKEGEFYILRGQKVWTSGGHEADYGWLLAKTKTDNSGPKHESFSQFIVEMKAPGVTIRPIVNMAGSSHFNEVFFDEVKVDSKFMVGQENEAFKQLMAQMDYERAGMERLLQNYPIYEKLLHIVNEMGKKGKDDAYYAWVKDAVAQLEIELNIGRLLCYYTAWTIDMGRKPTSEAALTKAYCNQYEQRLNDLTTRVLGPVSQIRAGSPWSFYDGEIAEGYLWSPSYTLQGGSVEVLKNIVALKRLGLPRK